MIGHLAHGLVQRANLPIPEWLFGWAAAVVLMVSFVALAVLWPRPRLEGNDGWRPLPGIGRALGSRTLETACGAAGALLLLLVVVAGFAGEQDTENNIAPTFVFITVWVGMVFASVLVGDVFRAFNPWRAIGRAAGWAAARTRRGRALEHRPYPARLGRWPAAAGLLAFAWLELASGGWAEQPDIVATAALVYSVATFAAMAVYGVEPWIERAEAFSVYFNLFSRLAPLERRAGVAGLRPPLAALTRLEPLPGTVALVAVMIGTVTFDGLSQGSFWADVAEPLNDLFSSAGVSGDGVDRLTNSVGLVLGVGFVAGFYSLGILGARSVGGNHTAEGLRSAFVHTLVPIAMVYVAAHYLTFLLFEGQGIVSLASDPLGKGWDLFGTASDAVDYGLIGQNQAWYAQVVLVITGHTAALVLAHERALVLYDKARLATRSQYWMLAVMIGFTTLALWLLAQAGTAVTAGEGSSTATATSDRLVNFAKKPPYVNGLEIDPQTGDFLLTTNRGFWRIRKDSGEVKRIRSTIAAAGKRDTVGTFLVAEPVGGRRLIGSGHPDHQNTLPQFLGYIESRDGGRTWRVLARLGDADLHKIVRAHGRLYGYDAVLSAILVSDDGGKSFTEHFAPRGLIIDFVVDPENPRHLLADNDQQVFRSRDGGDSWQPLLRAEGVRLSWPAPELLYRADRDGKIYSSPDRGESWNEVSRVAGEPYKFAETRDPRHVYLALSDGTILETTDAARNWEVAFRP